MRNWILALAAAACILPMAASALTLAEAKSQGLIGEQPDGYLGVVKSGGGAEDLVASVNAARKQEYQKIAEKNKQEISAVELLAAKRAYDLTQPGQYLKGADGSWQKK